MVQHNRICLYSPCPGPPNGGVVKSVRVCGVIPAERGENRIMFDERSSDCDVRGGEMEMAAQEAAGVQSFQLEIVGDSPADVTRLESRP